MASDSTIKTSEAGFDAKKRHGAKYQIVQGNHEKFMGSEEMKSAFLWKRIYEKLPDENNGIRCFIM